MGAITNAELEDARRRLGLNRAMAHDPLTNYMSMTLKSFAAHLEDALHEEGVEEELARRIIHRVVWGGMPHAVDATVRMDMMAERIDQARHGMTFPSVRDPKPTDPVTGDPVPLRASPTESTH